MENNIFATLNQQNSQYCSLYIYIYYNMSLSSLHAKVCNTWSYTCSSPYVFMSWLLIHRKKYCTSAREYFCQCKAVWAWSWSSLQSSVEIKNAWNYTTGRHSPFFAFTITNKACICFSFSVYWRHDCTPYIIWIPFSKFLHINRP
jgi:hypothetical protein